MSVVHINTIAAEDESEFIDQTQADCFNTKHSQDLLDIIRSCSLEVNLRETQYLMKSNTISFN